MKPKELGCGDPREGSWSSTGDKGSLPKECDLVDGALDIDESGLDTRESIGCGT